MYRDFDHEAVITRSDRLSGMTAVVAVHSTALGPAAGGCRRWVYPDRGAALEDALKLSRGMTLKNALAGVPFGGGKSVILSDGQAPTERQLAVFAEWLNELDGQYVTAEDVGMGLAQIRTLARYTSHVSGLGREDAGLDIGGDPSPKTAYGVFLGLERACQIRLGTSDLRGVRVAVMGLGAVGMALCAHLHNTGALLTVTDLDQKRVAMAIENFGATGVAPDELLLRPHDVFAPCALGGVIDHETAKTIPVRVIAGAANNQLVDDVCADLLNERNVLYAPDFVVNAGGVISVSAEILMQQGRYEASVAPDVWVQTRIDGISERLTKIVQEAHKRGVSTARVAEEQALRIVTGNCQQAA